MWRRSVLASTLAANIITRLVVHVASGHEARGDGSVHARLHRLLLGYGAVPSALLRAALPLTILKWKFCMSDAWVLVDDA